MTEQEFLACVNNKLCSLWNVPVCSMSMITLDYEIRAVFRINENGRISNLRLAKSSKNALADQALLKAIQKASPFEPPAGESKIDLRVAVSCTRDHLLKEIRTEVIKR